MSANHKWLSGPEWEAARARVLRRGVLCHLCGRPLDFDAAPRSRWSPSVDHVTPLAVLRFLPPAIARRKALDPANLRPAHYGCNGRKGAKRARTVERTVSRRW